MIPRPDFKANEVSKQKAKKDDEKLLSIAFSHPPRKTLPPIKTQRQMNHPHLIRTNEPSTFYWYKQTSNILLE